MDDTRTAAAELAAKAQEDTLRKLADSPGGAAQEAAKKQRLMSSPGITRGPPLPDEAERNVENPKDWKRFATIEGSIPLHDPTMVQKPAAGMFQRDSGGWRRKPMVTHGSGRPTRP